MEHRDQPETTDPSLHHCLYQYVCTNQDEIHYLDAWVDFHNSSDQYTHLMSLSKSGYLLH